MAVNCLLMAAAGYHRLQLLLNVLKYATDRIEMPQGDSVKWDRTIYLTSPVFVFEVYDDIQ